ncbi:hypothetical protein [Riemerella anatipestifer]|uniref:hypothetical protein n=1 Tax=Riemerella anatipestifer TaxID=34085 RepID=UPI00129EF560|nr:hypothetical protein [Riemerella anatipestifer]MRM83381.1 hypothetical protein [Riemerella anatipestifer]
MSANKPMEIEIKRLNKRLEKLQKQKIDVINSAEELRFSYLGGHLLGMIEGSIIEIEKQIKFLKKLIKLKEL